MQGAKQPEIGIQDAYAQMTDPMRETPFSIRLVKSGGKEIAQYRRLYRCRYGKKPGSGKTRSQREAEKVINGTERRGHVENGTIPIHDLEQNRYVSPLLSHIVEFNQYKVIH
jgi:hypothetical protein